MKFSDKIRKFSKFGVLFALAILTIGSMMAFAEGGDTSYSLTITKKVVDHQGNPVSGNNDKFEFVLQLEPHDDVWGIVGEETDEEGNTRDKYGLIPCKVMVDTAEEINWGYYRVSSSDDEGSPSIPENGRVEFTLGNNESVTFDLTCGYEYTLTEKNNSDYTTTITGDSKAVSAGNNLVTVTNKMPEPKGAYYIVHEYYWDEGLTDRIGATDPERKEAALDSSHEAEPGMYRYTFADYTGNGTFKHKEDRYGTVSGGTATEISGKTSAIATKDGNEIIIMRYYLQGTYKVVHEYYRDKGLTVKVGQSDIETKGPANLGTEHTVESEFIQHKTDFNGKNYTHASNAYGMESGGTATVTPGKTSATATEEGNEIIILRYYLAGGYKIRHEYYTIPWNSDLEVDSVTLDDISDPQKVQHDIDKDYPDKEGDLSLVDGRHYTTGDVTKREIERYKYQRRLDAYETEKGKTGPDGYVIATEDSEGTIVLRYVRKQEPNTGYYKVLHKYFFEDKDGNRTPEGEEGPFDSEYHTLPQDVPHHHTSDDVTSRTTHTYEGKTHVYEYKYDEDAYVIGKVPTGNNYVIDTENGEQTIVLTYVRTADMGFYQVVHEYYRDEVAPGNLVGRTELEPSAPVKLPDETQHTANSSMWKTEFQGKTYTHVSDVYGKTSGNGNYSADNSMSYVVATEEGEQVIILQYVLKEEPQKNALTITKTVNGEGADPSAVFTFTVTLTGEGAEEVNGSYGDLTFYNGVATITLRGGESATASGLPAGLGYTVTEAPAEGYAREQKDGQSGTITAEGTTADFVNTFVPEPTEDIPDGMVPLWNPETEEWIFVPEDDIPLDNMEVPQTGDESGIVMWGVLALVSMGGLAVLTTTKRRSKEQ